MSIPLLLLEFYVAGEWVIRLVMLVVVTRRRRPTSAMAWLLVIFFLPWVGLAAYLLVGRRKPHPRRLRKHEELKARVEGLRDRLMAHPDVFHPDLEEGRASAAAFIEHLGSMPALGGSHVEFFDRAEAFFDQLVADIDGAEEYVHLLFYIFADDAVGRRVAEALARAVERGVSCRVLVDALGSKRMLKSLAGDLRAKGIEVHAALPVGLAGARAGRIDLRNHRKVVVIDGPLGYTGSQNITDPSYGHADLVWRDIMARMTGPIVLELQALFLSDWFVETGEFLDLDTMFRPPAPTGDAPIQVLPSGPVYPRENYQRLVVAAIHHARKRVVITTPYLIPDEPLLQAMETAVLRGVEVHLVVPEKCDQRIPGAAARSYYSDLLSCGVQLHLYTEALLHVKSMTLDGAVAFFGSSNFDIRSFEINFEINVIFYGQKETDWLVAQQEDYMRHARLLTTGEWSRRTSTQRTLDNLARLVSPLL